MASISSHAHARIGLLGNPSDLYGGRGLGFAVAELRATVTLAEAEANELPNDLLRAGWTVFAARLQQHGIDPKAQPFALTATSDIPFQAGLSGSSALLTAALRAWSRWFGLPLAPSAIAELAWHAENDVLHIRAGALDRLVQAHGGLLAMDFARPFADGAVQRLDPALLPPLLLAWHGVGSQSSGDVHAPIWARFQAGDRQVRDVMAQLAQNADDGRQALLAGDRAAFLRCVDRNFDLRAQVFAIAPADRALIELGRAHGAGSKFPGSGGAVLYACRDEAMRDALEASCRAHGHATLRPTVAPPSPRLCAVFLAAGFATRLYPLTLTRAKPLLPVGGQPLMTRILRQVERAGAVEKGIVVSNGRFAADFRSWASECGARLPLQIVDDGALTNETRLGAVRDLALALDQLPTDAAHDGFLVLACDNLFDFDLGRLVARFAADGRGQLVVRTVPEPVPAAKYSEVLLDGERVARFREKPQDPQSNLSAIAVYLLPRQLPALVRSYLADGGNPDAPGHLLAWLSTRMPLSATRLDGRWLDIGSAADLAAAATMELPRV
jgi:glucose-1-phosphate thymidylyltransferase